MKRIFHKYETLEDSRAGLYRFPSVHDCQIQVDSSAILLRNQGAFFREALAMIHAWPKAAEANLSNKSLNRQAWIGHATYCYFFGANESQGIEAWHQLTVQEQLEANATADEVIKIWEEENAEKIS